MTKSYSKRQGAERPDVDAETLRLSIQQFVDACRSPALIDSGDQLTIDRASFMVEIRSGRLWIEAWDHERNLARRILGITSQARGRMVCSVHRFAGRPGELTLFDLDHPRNAQKALFSDREKFAEQFRTMLSRQFPGWNITTLSAAMDLQRSFSPVFPRAHVMRGGAHIAAIACPRSESEPGMLTFALIWHEYLRKRASGGSRVSLALFLPDGAGNVTAHRLRWLTCGDLAPRIFRFNDHGSAGEIDPQDLGNLETRINRQQLSAAGPKLPHFTQIKPPERTLEAVVRGSLHALDPYLLLHPVYSQVLSFAGGDRELVDLLAISADGRPVILELKVSEDIHLPLQGLDYWMRVKWHVELGEFGPLFPGVSIGGRSPKLILAAPAMSFHSTHATVLSYFSPEIEVERIGINSDWQRQLRVLLRLHGADHPISHGGEHAIPGSGQYTQSAHDIEPS